MGTNRGGNMNKIYVVLSATPTKIGMMIRTLTRSSFNHASISLTRDLSEMYSFARYRAHNPLVGGFIQEFPQRLTLGKDRDVQIKVFEISVSDIQYQSIKDFIYGVRDDEERCIYNSLAILGRPFGMGCNTYKAYVCTDFVVKALLCGSICLSKDAILAPLTPREIEELLDQYLIYSGSLLEYHPAPVYDESLVEEFFRKNSIRKEVHQIISHFYSLYRRAKLL
jgi:hypothetical protein